jgi:hypothetical protein
VELKLWEPAKAMAKPTPALPVVGGKNRARVRRRRRKHRASVAHRPLPLRRQNEPELIQPHGHDPFGGFGIASCAPALGTQNEPLDR